MAAKAASTGTSRLMWITLGLAALVLFILKVRTRWPAVTVVLIPAAILLFILALPGKRERRQERRARTSKIVQDALK